MKMEININDYVDKEEIKETILDAIKETVKHNYEYNTENFVSNLSYDVLKEMCNEYIPGFEAKIKENLLNVINNLSEYTVFNEDKKASMGYEYINKALEENKELISNRVKEKINEIDSYDITRIIEKWMLARVM